MKIYHGTTGAVLKSILREGIRPRCETDKDNWGSTFNSQPECVYLTVAYPLHFMWNASKKGSKYGAVIEIDTDLLDLDQLVPDEDTLAQGEMQTCPLEATGSNIIEKTRYYRDHLHEMIGENEWERFLKAMGNCAHFGTIPIGAITRTVQIDLKKNRHLIFQFDPTITLMNYQILGPKYRACSMALFGDEPEGELLDLLKKESGLFGNWNPQLVDPVIKSYE